MRSGVLPWQAKCLKINTGGVLKLIRKCMGKKFVFHLTAHSNTLAASSWVLELILPQIYLIRFRSPFQ